MIPLRHVLRSSLRLQSLRPALRPAFRPPQRPYYMQTPRPTTLGAKIWFRADGTPRSKIRGLVITSLLSGLLYATWQTLLVVEALDYEHYLLSVLVHIQRVDYDYSTIAFDSYRGALAYFAEVCAYLGQGDVPPEMLDTFFDDVIAFEQDAERREAAHAIVRDAAEAVHEILARSKGRDAAETAALVVDVVDRAMVGLIELAEDVGEDAASKIKILREQMAAKDAAKGYEILG
ncbi:hypothetical protein B0H19DRAFT_1130778 [Mycena capillaripes]|nr:hypothetical protein B0H19DRAFT_1130778 [Mycena capillaripes]